MIKRLVRSCVAAVCRGSGMLARAQRAAAGDLVILCYHRVLPQAARAAYFAPDLVITPEAFHTHCQVLRRHFEVLPLHAAVNAWSRGICRNRPIAAITFDDGYQDNYIHAAPILAEAGLKATFFVVSGLVGRGMRPWYDQLAVSVRVPTLQALVLERMNGHLSAALAKGNGRGGRARQIVSAAKELPAARRRELLDELFTADQRTAPDQDCIMTREQLRELLAAGHEIGAHTRTHDMLPQLDDAALADEIAGSRRELEALLAAPVHSFCYPNGSYDERVVDQVRAAGFAQAVTTQEGRNRAGQDLFQLRRWFIHQERLAGCSGRPSGTLLRMEILGLSQRFFRKNRSADKSKSQSRRCNALTSPLVSSE